MAYPARHTGQCHPQGYSLARTCLTRPAPPAGFRLPLVFRWNPKVPGFSPLAPASRAGSRCGLVGQKPPDLSSPPDWSGSTRRDLAYIVRCSIAILYIHTGRVPPERVTRIIRNRAATGRRTWNRATRAASTNSQWGQHCMFIQYCGVYSSGVLYCTKTVQHLPVDLFPRTC